MGGCLVAFFSEHLPYITLFGHVVHRLVLRCGSHMVEMGRLANMETSKAFLSSLSRWESAEVLQQLFSGPKIRPGWTADYIRIV